MFDNNDQHKEGGDLSVNTAIKTKPERIAPRRRRPRRSVWRRIVWPLIKPTAIVAFAIFVLGKIARPFRLYDQEYSETRQIALELESLRKENASLERQIKHLKTTEGAAQAARKLGWVKPGEITLVIPQDDKRSER